MLNGCEKREVKCSNILLVGVSHKLTRSTKVYVDREGETSVLKKWNVDGVVILGSCGSSIKRAVVRNFRRVCVMLNAAGIAVDVLLSRSRSRLTFWTFVDHFIITFGSNRLQKLWKGRLLNKWKKKKKKEKDLLNCKYKVRFQQDGSAEPTWAATCFIHFGFGHRVDNIRFLKGTFVVFYLFVYLLFLLVS